MDLVKTTESSGALRPALILIEGGRLEHEGQELVWAPVGLPDTASDGRTLGELEGVIRRGLETYVEVGMALLSIRERRLYREGGFAAFEDYCRERWGWGRDYADRQIKAARAVEEMPTIVSKSVEEMRESVPIGAPLPQNEAQARQLARVEDPKERAEVWEEVVQEAEAEETPVTARRVEEKARKRQNPSPKKPPEKPHPPTIGGLVSDDFEPPSRELTAEQNNFYETHRHADRLRRLNPEEEAAEWLEVKDDGVKIDPHIRAAEDAEHYYASLAAALRALEKQYCKKPGNMYVVGGKDVG